MNNKFGLRGHLRVWKGEELVIDTDNLITDAGLEEVAKLIGSGLNGTSFGYIAFGTGTTVEANTDTTLETEIDRVQATIELDTTNVSNDTVKLTATHTASGTEGITEYGIFNAGSGGTMLSRKVKDVVNLSAGESITIEWKIWVERA